MNFRKLEHFVKIVQAGSLSRAAERLGLSQPVLSRELRDLEREMGLPLLCRHARGVTATPAGEALKRRAEIILEMLDGVRDELHAAADEPSGRLSFGMPMSMSGVLTGPVVAQYRLRYPAVRLHVREAMSTPLRNALLSHELDVGILSGPVTDPQLRTWPLLTEPVMLVGPPSARLSPRRKVSLQTLAAHPLILPTPSHAVRNIVDSALEGVGLRPQVVLEVEVAPLADLVMRGIGYSVLPSCATTSMTMVASGMKYAPIDGLFITWLVAQPARISPSLASIKLCAMICDLTRTLILHKQWRAEFLADPFPATAR